MQAQLSYENSSNRMASCLGFFNSEDLVCGNVRERLHGPAWPAYADFFHFRVGAEAEVNAGIAGTGVAYGSRGFIPLRVAIPGCDANLGAKPHAIAACSDQSNQQPVLGVGSHVPEELDRLVQAGDNCVDSPGVKDVSERCTPVGAGNLKAGTSAGTDVLKLPVSEVS